MTELAREKFDEAAPETDGQLVTRTLAGDLAGFDELVSRYQRKATGVAYHLLNNRDDALEVTQESFLRAFDRLATLEEPQRFGSWLLRILSNQALNRRRSRALRKTASLEACNSSEDDSNGMTPRDASTPTPLEEVSGRDMRSLVRRAIDDLPDMDRQALVLFSIEKIPQRQVAEIMNCSLDAVKWHVFTARKKLKQKLAKFL